MSSDLQQKIGQALEGVSDSHAQMLTSPDTQLVTVSASFLNTYRIYELTHRAPNKPIQFYVGYAENKPVYLITGQPDNYFKIAQEDRVQLGSEAKAVEYAALYLRVSRPVNRLFYVVSHADQIKFRPTLDAAQKEVKSAFLKRYESAINNPAAVQFDGQQYIVTLYVIHEQEFKQYILTVDMKGRLLNTEITVLEKGLPLVYGL